MVRVSEDDLSLIRKAYSEVTKVFPFPGYMFCERRYTTLAMLIKKELPPGRKILDIGCGPCDKAAMLSRLGYKITGVDDLGDPWHLIGSNRERIREFAESFGIELRIQSIWSFTENTQFDAVMLIDILEHITKPRDLLNLAISFLKPGGLLFIETPNSAALGKRLRSVLGKSIWPDISFVYYSVGDYRTHVREYTVHELVKLLKLGGLTSVEYETANLSTEELIGEVHGIRKCILRAYELVSRLRFSFLDTILTWGIKPRDWSPFGDFLAFERFKTHYPHLTKYNLDRESDKVIVSKLRKQASRLRQ